MAVLVAWSKVVAFLVLGSGRALMGKCTLLGKARGVVWLAFMVRLVGALGRDQTYVSTGNPSYRKSSGRRGGAREGAVPGAGVGPGSGGNRVGSRESWNRMVFLLPKVELGGLLRCTGGFVQDTTGQDLLRRLRS